MAETVQERDTILQEIRTAVRHMAVYGLGSVLVKALGFFMLPFYTHYLNPRDYGILEILDLSMSLFALVLSMGLTPAFLRCYVAAASEEKHRVVSTGCLFGFIVGLATFVAGIGLVRPASTLIFGPTVPSTYVLLSFSALVLNFMATLPRTFLRALEASGAYITVDAIGVFALLVLNVFFIAVLKVGLAGVLYSSLIVAAVQFVAVSIWAVRRAGIRFHVPHLERMLRFGLPLILSNTGLFVLNFSDRFFLQHLRSLEVVGVYAVGYKFGFMMNYLVVQPFFTMWQSRMYAIHKQPQHAAIFRRVFELYSFGLTYAGLAMSLFGAEAVHFMAERKFWGSRDVIPVVVLAYVFYGLSYYAQVGLLLTDRTRIVGIIGGVAAVLNLVLNYVLISEFGMMGAAWATVLSFAFLAIASYICSQRVFRLPLALGRMWAGLIGAAATYVLCRNFAPSASAAALLVRGAVLVLFPVVLWKVGVLGPAVVETVTAARSSVWRRVRKQQAHAVAAL